MLSSLLNAWSSFQVQKGMGKDLYNQEFEKLKKHFPEDECEKRITYLWEQLTRWVESFDQTKLVSINLSHHEFILLSHLKKIVPMRKIQEFLILKGPKNQLFTRLRTILAIAAVIDNKDNYIYAKKWKGELFPTLGFFVDKRESKVSIYVRMHRFYKFNQKTIYRVFELVSGDYSAGTVMDKNFWSTFEIKFPHLINTGLCPYLVPPYFLLAEIKHKSGKVKYLALNELFVRDISRIGITYEIHLDAILAAAKGADYIHQSGYSHQDIKPTNLFIRKDGSICLGDYGLTSKLGDLRVPGTSWFCSPDAYKKDSRVSPKDAIWEIAATGLCLLGCSLIQDDFVDFKMKGKLTQDFVDKYLADLREDLISINILIPNLQKFLFLFDLYVCCYRLNADERPNLIELINVFEILKKT